MSHSQERHGRVVSTYRLSSIDQIVEVATTLTRSWFRGHGKVVGELTPRIYREEFNQDIYAVFRPQLELEFIELFKADAPAIAEGPIPKESDRLGWLYLMQHYRAPTRLLDWTQSALAALFFAVSAETDSDGELWALNPKKLNAVGETGNALPLLDTNPVLRYLVDAPYWAGDPDALAREYKMDRAPMCPVAFPPRRNFARMVAQESVFTIHPPPALGCTIPELLADEEDLVRYTIPKSSKTRLLHDLRALGVNDRTLFPDFEGLSRHVIADSLIVAYTPPKPPKADGPVEDDRIDG